MERNAGCAEDDQKKMASSEYSNPVLKDNRAVLNFSELSPCRFGISVQRFTPASNPKGELTDPYMMLSCCYICCTVRCFYSSAPVVETITNVCYK